MIVPVFSYRVLLCLINKIAPPTPKNKRLKPGYSFNTDRLPSCSACPCLSRVGGGPETMPTHLVQVCRHVSEVELLPAVGGLQEVGAFCGDGPFCRLGHHHLYCAQHPVHGHGALPHDPGVQLHAFSGKSGQLFSRTP